MKEKKDGACQKGFVTSRPVNLHGKNGQKKTNDQPKKKEEKKSPAQVKRNTTKPVTPKPKPADNKKKTDDKNKTDTIDAKVKITLLKPINGIAAAVPLVK